MNYAWMGGLSKKISGKGIIEFGSIVNRFYKVIEAGGSFSIYYTFDFKMFTE